MKWWQTFIMLIVIFLTLLLFFKLFGSLGFLSVFGGEYTLNFDEGVAKSNKQFGTTTSGDGDPEHPQKYWDVYADVGNEIIKLSGSATCVDIDDPHCPPGLDLQSTTIVAKTSYLKIESEYLDKLTVYFKASAGGYNYGMPQSAQIYLTDGSNDILLYSKGSTYSGFQQNSRVILTQDNGDYFVKVADGESEMINVPAGEYELMGRIIFGDLTQNANEGATGFGASLEITDIEIELQETPECYSDSECPEDVSVEVFCYGNEFREKINDSFCEDNVCKSKVVTDTLEVCDYKCDDLAGCIEFICSDEELSCSWDKQDLLRCENNDWVVQETCENGCSNESCKSAINWTLILGVFVGVLILVTIIVLVVRKRGK